MLLGERERRALEARLKFARELGIYDLYRRPVDAGRFRFADVAPHAEAEIISATPENFFEEQDIARTPAVLSVISQLPYEPFAGADKRAALHALQQEIGLCMRCPLATAGRHTVVFADGDPDAELMFVGEGPGADEDAQGLPFVGRAGQLLNNMISAMGLARADVYIANIVKCRPPKNRAPEPIEANTCLPFLARQHAIVRPKVVVALGATAALYLTGRKAPLMEQRGRLHVFRESKLLITYHPAYLLRDPSQKKAAWADLQIAMQYLGIKAAKKEQ